MAQTYKPPPGTTLYLIPGLRDNNQVTESEMDYLLNQCPGFYERFFTGGKTRQKVVGYACFYTSANADAAIEFLKLFSIVAYKHEMESRTREGYAPANPNTPAPTTLLADPIYQNLCQKHPFFDKKTKQQQPQSSAASYYGSSQQYAQYPSTAAAYPSTAAQYPASYPSSYPSSGYPSTAASSSPANPYLYYGYAASAAVAAPSSASSPAAAAVAAAGAAGAGSWPSTASYYGAGSAAAPSSAAAPAAAPAVATTTPYPATASYGAHTAQPQSAWNWSASSHGTAYNGHYEGYVYTPGYGYTPAPATPAAAPASYGQGYGAAANTPKTFSSDWPAPSNGAYNPYNVSAAPAPAPPRGGAGRGGGREGGGRRAKRMSCLEGKLHKTQGIKATGWRRTSQ
jgi:hypothetical protein